MCRNTTTTTTRMSKGTLWVLSNLTLYTIKPGTSLAFRMEILAPERTKQSTPTTRSLVAVMEVLAPKRTRQSTPTTRSLAAVMEVMF